MPEDAETYSQAEIVRLLQRLDKNVDTLSTDLKRLEVNYVTRAEWSMRTQYVDRELKALKDADRASAPAKVSGWTIAAVVVSALVGVGSLLSVAVLLVQNLR